MLAKEEEETKFETLLQEENLNKVRNKNRKEFS